MPPLFYCCHPGILGFFNLTLKSSAEILAENNARRLLKSVQNPEILIYNISLHMSEYFTWLQMTRASINFQIQEVQTSYP